MANLEIPTSPAKSAKKRRSGPLHRLSNWLFSQQHFHFKLLSGTIVGVVVIVLLAGAFLYVTLRNHLQDTLRVHTMEVMHLSSLVENDIAAMESAHRGFLLTGDPRYVTTFNRQRQLVHRRLEDLILGSPAQRKRVVKVKAVIEQWIESIALPEIKARQDKDAAGGQSDREETGTVDLGNAQLNQARDVLQSIQDEEQIVLNQRMHDQEWATQSTQILDYLPKLERTVVAMQKEKRGYLLTGEPSFVEAYKRAVADFYTYHGYLSVLVANSPSQATLLAEIRAKLENWINRSAVPEMDAMRAGKDAAKMAASDGGDALMSTIGQMLVGFEQNELRVHEMRATSASRERIINTTALAALAFLAISLLVSSNSYSFVMVRRQMNKLEGIETRISSIMENIVDGMITVDKTGTIRSMNRAAAKMFGCRDSEMIGHDFTRLVPKRYAGAHDPNPSPCAWPDMIRGTGRTILALGRTRKHLAFPIEISLSEMNVHEGKVYVIMIRDVTERKRFEQQIAAEKESLAVTLHSIGDGVITTDGHGKIIMINSEAERLTGWTSHEAVGQPLKSVFDVRIDLAAQAKAQKSGYRNEAQSILLNLPENATLTARDGHERVIEQVASPIRDNKNEIADVVLVFRDITERQRIDAERKAETLEQLGLFAGGIAHDFNNLLTAIIGNISLASSLVPPDSEMATRLKDAKNASLRARDLAQQLLTFARDGAPIKKTVSIGKLIQDTVSFSLRGSHSRSEFHLGSDLWPAEIDSGQISQVIANLVVNADQAMRNGGTLHVSCENLRYTSATTPAIPDLAPGDYIHIKIRDEGVGIPEKYLKRIFDPYFTTKQKGNGLGLATAYSVIKNHNGLLTVESEVHLGSTFHLYLPAAVRQKPAVEGTTTPVAVQPVTGTGRVLIVDDEEAIRALVELTLTQLGYQVTPAGTALEGVNIYRQKLVAGERFDAVILDLTLPGGMGGKEALKKLIEIDPTVNAIISSGYATDATMRRYQDFGFRAVITKPYEAAQLGKIVHDVISSGHVNVVSDYQLQAAG
jgi:PAS domain S-box-containing protein